MRFITGMVIAPVVSTLEITEPESEPISADDTTATFAGPPRERPIRAVASFMKNSPPPVMVRAEPKTTKPITRLATTCMGMPMMLSTPMAWMRMVPARS